MKIYIIAGEPSGDLHAARLVTELRRKDANCEIRAWGGDLMEKAGAKLVKHYKETAFMGFLTVAKNSKTILKNIEFCKKDILFWKPDVLILVDYPGFNLKIAKYANSKNIPVFYFISPKIWAWKKWRIKTIKKFVDRMYVIFPFEEDFYKRQGYRVYYVGNPLVNIVDEFLTKRVKKEVFIRENGLSGKPIISLLPGSRKQEIQCMLPIMARVADSFPEYEFVIAGTAGLPKSFYTKYAKKKNIKILFDKTYALVSQSAASIVSSGTATLETALLNTPQVVVYKQKGGLLLEKIARWVYPHFFSLVNLILKKEVVKELFMTKVTEKAISSELKRILFDEDYKNSMLAEYRRLKDELGTADAAQKTANLVIKHLG